MSIITKAIASEVAVKLTAKKQDEIKKLDLKLKEQFEAVYLKSLPKDVVSAFENAPNYFNTSNSVQVSGNGFNWQSLGFTKKMPVLRNCSYQLSDKEATLFLKKYNEIEYKKSKCRDLIYEIENALVSLRSYKKISETFPEAIPFLPEKITTALAVNISDIQDKLK